jgi:hypothetical protein
VFYRIATRVSNVAGRQGVFAAASGNLNKDNGLRRKPRDRNDLAFSDFDFGFRPFPLSFGFFLCNDTRNDTRRERLRVPFVGELGLQTPSLRFDKHYGVFHY